MSRAARIAVCLLTATLLVSCGSGQDANFSLDKNSPAPEIFALLESFPTGAVPPGFPSGLNSFASVEVTDAVSSAVVSNASVWMNGVALAYNPADQQYEGDLSVAPGDTVTLTVSTRGSVYMASTKQFSTYPTITAPLAGATWSSTVVNTIFWSSGGPGTPQTTVYVPAVVDADPNGNQIWPAPDARPFWSYGESSALIPQGNLTKGERLVVVGILNYPVAPIPNAAAGSGLGVIGFNYVPITVTDVPPPPVAPSLVSVAVAPKAAALVVKGTTQLVATGTYSDSSSLDLTSQVNWQSSDPSVADVDITGLVTGVADGSATITASLQGNFDTMSINVFTPNPSPPPPLSQSVAYQVDYAHSGRAAFGTSLTLPTGTAWSVTVNGASSYPLIAEGKVFVTTASGGNPYGTSLYALDEQTGNVAWGPIAISGTYFWSGHAYDHGKIFVVNFDGLLRSFDAATGKAGWSVQLPGQYAFDSPPTAVNGVVYVGGAGSGGTVYAVNESNGNVLWTAPVWGGDDSSPAVSSDGVFVSYPCQAYKFEPFTGGTLWHYAGGCSGGGGRTPAVANGKLYMRDWTTGAQGKVFDAATGTEVGSFTANPIPAFSGQHGYFLSSGNLTGVDLNANSTSWSFAGDGGLASAPIVVNQTVFVGSSSGNVYALDGATGSQLWVGNAGAAITAPDEQSVSQPLTGLGAGEGYLIVPAGNRITAWHIVAP